jgi:hypothetical protein
MVEMITMAVLSRTVGAHRTMGVRMTKMTEFFNL